MYFEKKMPNAKHSFNQQTIDHFKFISNKMDFSLNKQIALKTFEYSEDALNMQSTSVSL